MTDIFPPPFSVVVHKIDALENTETQHGYLMELMRHRAMLAAAPAQDEDGDRIKELQERLQDALECIRKLSAERVNVRAAVHRLHSAKERQKKQQALYDLFDLIGL